MHGTIERGQVVNDPLTVTWMVAEWWRCRENIKASKEVPDELVQRCFVIEELLALLPSSSMEEMFSRLSIIAEIDPNFTFDRSGLDSELSNSAVLMRSFIRDIRSFDIMY